MKTKYEIGDLVSVASLPEFHISGISIGKDQVVKYSGPSGHFYPEENLTLLQPVGSDFKVGAMVCKTQGISVGPTFVINRIYRTEEGVLKLGSKYFADQRASSCTLVATDEIPKTQIADAKDREIKELKEHNKLLQTHLNNIAETQEKFQELLGMSSSSSWDMVLDVAKEHLKDLKEFAEIRKERNRYESRMKDIKAMAQTMLETANKQGRP